MTERILNIGAGHHTVKTIILHVGTNEQPEVLKQDFIDLLSTVSFLNSEVFMSGSLVPVRRGVERCSR